MWFNVRQLNLNRLKHKWLCMDLGGWAAGKGNFCAEGNVCYFALNDI